MATLCEKHGCGFLFTVPVAADKAVAVMNILHSLECYHGHYFADRAAVYDILYLFIERSIAEDMADYDSGAFFMCRFGDIRNFFHRLCDGLLEKQVVAELDSLHCGFIVHIVESRDYGDIRKFRAVENFFP